MPSIDQLRCVVLGASGFIGINLCERLRGRTTELRAFGRHRPADVLDAIAWIKGDFLNRETLSLAVRGADIVFHLVNATTPASANADMVNDLSQNVIGTLALLEICRAAGVKRVVFASSGGTIYGVPRRVPTPESEPCWPISAYGISKLSIERYLHLYEHHHGLEYRVLRIANPFGPYQTAASGQGVIAAFLRSVLTEEPVHIWGDGSVARDYLHVADVAAALEAAAVHTGPDRIFNIGSVVTRTLNEIVEAIEWATGRMARIDRQPSRGVDVPISCLDISLAVRALGWQPTTNFHEGLRLTSRWMESQLHHRRRADGVLQQTL